MGRDPQFTKELAKVEELLQKFDSIVVAPQTNPKPDISTQDEDILDSMETIGAELGSTSNIDYIKENIHSLIEAAKDHWVSALTKITILTKLLKDPEYKPYHEQIKTYLSEIEKINSTIDDFMAGIIAMENALKPIDAETLEKQKDALREKVVIKARESVAIESRMKESEKKKSTQYLNLAKATLTRIKTLYELLDKSSPKEFVENLTDAKYLADQKAKQLAEEAEAKQREEAAAKQKEEEDKLQAIKQAKEEESKKEGDRLDEKKAKDEKYFAQKEIVYQSKLKAAEKNTRALQDRLDELGKQRDARIEEAQKKENVAYEKLPQHLKKFLEPRGEGKDVEDKSQLSASIATPTKRMKKRTSAATARSEGESKHVSDTASIPQKNENKKTRIADIKEPVDKEPVDVFKQKTTVDNLAPEKQTFNNILMRVNLLEALALIPRNQLSAIDKHIFNKIQLTLNGNLAAKFSPNRIANLSEIFIAIEDFEALVKQKKMETTELMKSIIEPYTVLLNHQVNKDADVNKAINAVNKFLLDKEFEPNPPHNMWLKGTSQELKRAFISDTDYEMELPNSDLTYCVLSAFAEFATNNKVNERPKEFYELRNKILYQLRNPASDSNKVLAIENILMSRSSKELMGPGSMDKKQFEKLAETIQAGLYLFLSKNYLMSYAPNESNEKNKTKNFVDALSTVKQGKSKARDILVIIDDPHADARLTERQLEEIKNPSREVIYITLEDYKSPQAMKSDFIDFLNNCNKDNSIRSIDIIGNGLGGILLTNNANVVEKKTKVNKLTCIANTSDNKNTNKTAQNDVSKPANLPKASSSENIEKINVEMTRRHTRFFDLNVVKRVLHFINTAFVSRRKLQSNNKWQFIQGTHASVSYSPYAEHMSFLAHDRNFATSDLRKKLGKDHVLYVQSVESEEKVIMLLKEHHKQQAPSNNDVKAPSNNKEQVPSNNVTPTPTIKNE